MTMDWKRLSGILGVAALATIGCGDDDSGEADAVTDASACADLSYDSFGKKFMDDYCASCHAASVKGAARMAAPPEDVFDTLAQIKADKAELKDQVTVLKAMPFPTADAQPSDDERAKFAQWLACGPN